MYLLGLAKLVNTRYFSNILKYTVQVLESYDDFCTFF